jgi:hypothetical protein
MRKLKTKRRPFSFFFLFFSRRTL